MKIPLYRNILKKTLKIFLMVYHLGHTVKDIKLDAIVIDPNVSHSQTGAFDVFPHSPC